MGVAVAATIPLALSTPALNIWTRTGAVPKVLSVVDFSTAAHITSILILNLILNIHILQGVLHQKELRINPLHPDKCGGLRPLSQYALKTAYLAAVFGIMLGFTEYRLITQGLAVTYWTVHLSIPLYVILSLGCFFGPLLTAHTGMQEAKERLLHVIAQQFQEDYHQTQAVLSGDAESLKKGSSKIQELRSFYALTDEFPVWPFNLKTLRTYVLSVITPLLLPLLGLIGKVSGQLICNWGIKLG